MRSLGRVSDLVSFSVEDGNFAVSDPFVVFASSCINNSPHPRLGWCWRKWNWREPKSGSIGIGILSDADEQFFRPSQHNAGPWAKDKGYQTLD